MSNPAERIVKQLEELSDDRAFATRLSIKGNPGINVVGVGPIGIPVDSRTAHRLCAVASPAHHGYKDETRLDPRVRDTWEIPADAIEFDDGNWQNVLGKALRRIERNLQLPKGVRFWAELHNMLVYGPGQFFSVHQDSEKADGMLATLVMILPSRFSGGEFVVFHQGKSLEAKGDKNRICLMAFYADCLHEVKPVRHGYRVVLTYNLIVDQKLPSVTAISDDQLGALTSAVRDFFDTPVPTAWARDSVGECPDRLVYLLDHQYTSSALSWKRLKGADIRRAKALRQVAGALDAEIYLALADIHERWTAEDDYGYGTSGSYHDEHTFFDDDLADDWLADALLEAEEEMPDDDSFRDDDGPFDDDEPWDEISLLESRLARKEQRGREGGPSRQQIMEPDLGELIEDEVALRHWVGEKGRVSVFDSSDVEDRELLYIRPTVDFKPFESEYEGYMGNYGNTVDRWYHRAAVVMWPRSREFVIRARLNPDEVMMIILDLFEDEETDLAMERLRQLLPIWSRWRRAYDAEPPGEPGYDESLRHAMAAAERIADQEDRNDIAFALLKPFSLCQLRPDLVPMLKNMQKIYGLAWLKDMMRSWRQPVHRSGFDYLPMFGDLPEVVAALMDDSGDKCRELAVFLTELCAQAWFGAITRGAGMGSMSIKDMKKELVNMASCTQQALWMCWVTDLSNSSGKIIEKILSVDQSLSFVLSLLSGQNRETLMAPWLKPITDHCLKTLASLLEKPPRARNDWSIPVPPSEDLQDLFQPLSEFLRSSETRELAWPLAAERRHIVHQYIQRYDLPVKHETLRKGRPYTLMLEKTGALFKQSSEQRAVWRRELVRLRKKLGV